MTGTETEAAAALAAAPKQIDRVDESHLITAVPPGWSVDARDLERYAEYPNRPRGDVIVRTSGAFVDAVRRRAPGAVTVYGDEASLSLVAVLNDDGAADGVAYAGWRDYRVVLGVTRTEAWEHWLGRNDALMTQEAFADHIQTGLAEIDDPAPADMLDLAQTLTATINARAKSARRLSDGATQIVWEEEIDAKGGVAGTFAIPTEFRLVVAPFYGAEAVPVRAFFRYRLGRGDAPLMLGYKLDRAADVERRAFRHLVAEVDATFGDDALVLEAVPPRPTRAE